MSRPEDITNVPGDAKSRMDRILRLHEEIDSLKEMIREVYGEEKDAGGDKTAMGAAVSIIRKRSKDAIKFDNAQGMVDLYLVAFAGASHTHAYARAQITEPQVAPQPASDLTAPQPLGQVADIQPAMASEPQPPVSAATDGGQELSVSSAPDSAIESEDSASDAGQAPSNLTTLALKPLRPYCQNPGPKCGGQGRRHCWSCERAHSEAGAA